MERIQASARHMTQLLDDVLFLGKTAAAKQEFKPSAIDLVQFCGELLEEVQLAWNADRKIHFICPDSCISARMDTGLLRHIFTNLLSNAIKYSAPDTVIRFELTHDQELAVFQIQDQGLGISEEDQQHLFESFHRGGNVGKIPGTGLGLAIVQQSTQLHRGTVAVKSQVGVGTTFTVKLPIYSEG
ncbi:HAMP domain-containing histidine kinase [Kovacikia minuta CCNUW1]|uniref:sensor histidine kinase n=1 Tax=Kovacikia minuta TaxID=2931930 RepID=UPI001CCA4D27|nr:HAMP domain-containing sensor histidine kinase [Kovacikia minuta]UBF25801.1 HAMP domain-containing histidine kinase [Kovacikia minuta CCNUW1]